MTQIIVHPQLNGEIMIVIPTGEFSVEEVAKKDVPAGVPYFIMDHTELPYPDWTYSASWEGDFSQPHGQGIGPGEWFAQKASADMAALQTIAEQENAQFDALQKLIAESKSNGN